MLCSESSKFYSNHITMEVLGRYNCWKVDIMSHDYLKVLKGLHDHRLVTHFTGNVNPSNGHFKVYIELSEAVRYATIQTLVEAKVSAIEPCRTVEERQKDSDACSAPVDVWGKEIVRYSYGFKQKDIMALPHKKKYTRKPAVISASWKPESYMCMKCKYEHVRGDIHIRHWNHRYIADKS